MANATIEMQQTLKLIRSVNLPHPDGELLVCFIEESIDPGRAARYLLQRCLVGEEKLNLEPFLSDWKQLVNIFVYNKDPDDQIHDKATITNIIKRDSHRCCITGLRNSFWDPLIVAPILPAKKIHVDENLHEILSIFVGPDLRDWVLSKAAVLLNPYKRHWLVRKSAAAALSEGFFQLQFNEGLKYDVFVVRIGGPDFPSIVNKSPTLRRSSFQIHPDSYIDNPDVSALQILSRFAKPIRWTLVAREIAGKRPNTASISRPLSIWHCISERSVTAFSMVWRLMPASIRIRTYYGLASLGYYMYGQSCSLKVQRLPLGMYLKVVSARSHESLANESAAMRLVRRYTQIPVPRTLDLVSNSKESFHLTTRVSGVSLGCYISTLSDNEKTTLICDLQKSIAELRAIPKLVAPEYAITNARGKACYDYRINAGRNYDANGDFIGPFVNEEEFNNILTCGALPHVSHRSGHQIVFTHGDLNLRNILMCDGKFSGIVDWETSGWYPEYWDYTKVHFITKLNKRWLGIADEVFKHFGDYDAEHSIERQLWHYCF